MKGTSGPGIAGAKASQKMTDEDPPQKYRNSVKEKNQKPPERPAGPAGARIKGPAGETEEERQANHEQAARDWKAKHGDKAPRVH